MKIMIRKWIKSKSKIKNGQRSPTLNPHLALNPLPNLNLHPNLSLLFMTVDTRADVPVPPTQSSFACDSNALGIKIATRNLILLRGGKGTPPRVSKGGDQQTLKCGRDLRSVSRVSATGRSAPNPRHFMSSKHLLADYTHVADVPKYDGSRFATAELAAFAGTRRRSDGPDTADARGGARSCPDDREPAVVSIRSAGQLHEAIGPVLAAMLDLGYSHRDMFAMRLSLEEAIVNAVKHGNEADPAKEVHIRYYITPEEAVAEVEDEGPGFDPRAVKDPLTSENLDRPGGRGLLLMEYYMTRVQYSERGNTVILGRLRSWE